eukprot:2614921-Prymnesium_polylepis.3
MRVTSDRVKRGKYRNLADRKSEIERHRLSTHDDPDAISVGVARISYLRRPAAAAVSEAERMAPRVERERGVPAPRPAGARRCRASHWPGSPLLCEAAACCARPRRAGRVRASDYEHK